MFYTSSACSAQICKDAFILTTVVGVRMRKTTRLKSGWGFGQTNSPLSTAKVLIDAVGLCLLRVSEEWWLFAPDLRRRINSFSGSDFKPRLVYKTWYFCYFSQTLTSSLRQSNCIHCDTKIVTVLPSKYILFCCGKGLTLRKGSANFCTGLEASRNENPHCLPSGGVHGMNATAIKKTRYITTPWPVC